MADADNSIMKKWLLLISAKCRTNECEDRRVCVYREASTQKQSDKEAAEEDMR
jgi:hypothetical protein